MNQSEEGTAGRFLVEVDSVTAGYVADIDILNDLSLTLDRGEVVTVIGPNGAGKSTLLKTMFGLLRASRGEVRVRNTRVDTLTPHQIVDLGMAYVPQLDNVFPSMTVEENLRISSRGLKRAENAARVDEMLNLFPDLAVALRRAAGLLSGGQRQMVAMARALMVRPEILLLDEPSAGLAPKYVDLVFERVVDINKSGVSVLIVEQNARRALAISDRGYVLELGHCRFEGKGSALLSDPMVAELYLGRIGRGQPIGEARPCG